MRTISIRPIPRYVYLAKENTVSFKLNLPSAHNIDGTLVLGDNDNGYRIQGAAQRSIHTKSVSFKVQFTRVGRIDLKIKGKVAWHTKTGIYKSGKVDSTPEIIVRSPFCRWGTKKPEYILARSKICRELDAWFSASDRVPLLWVYGLPQVGKTTLIREWRQKLPKSLYLNVALRRRKKETWHAWVDKHLGIPETEKKDLVDDAGSFWRDIPKYVQESEHAVIILDQAEVAFRDDSLAFVQLLVDILRIVQESGFNLKLKLIVVDMLPIKARAVVMEKIKSKRFYHTIQVMPFDVEELKNYIRYAPIPDDLVLASFQRRIEDAETAISDFYNITGGHPVLVNTYLCHISQLYANLSSQKVPDPLQKFRSLIDVEETDEFMRVATKFWKQCQKYEVLTPSEVQLISQIARRCPSCDAQECTVPPPKEFSSTWLASAKQHRDYQCPFLSPWVLRAARRR